MTILALDPGLTTGWALSSGETGTLDLREVCREDQGAAGCAFADWLGDMIATHGIRRLVLERPFGRHPDTEWAVYLCRRAHEVAYRHDLARGELTPSQVKKALTGNGNAKKDEVERALLARGWIFEDGNRGHHRSDAAAVLEADLIRQAQAVTA